MAADSFAAYQIEEAVTAIIDNSYKFQYVEADAITTLSNVVTSYANNILRNAKLYSEHAGNETLTIEDLFAGGEDYGLNASDLYNYTLVNVPFRFPPLPLFPVQNNSGVESFTFPSVVGSTVGTHLPKPNAGATQLIDSFSVNETPPSSSGSNESSNGLPKFLPPFPGSVQRNMIHPPILPMKITVDPPVDVTFDELHNDKAPVDLTPLDVPNFGEALEYWPAEESESFIRRNTHQRRTIKKQRSRARKAPARKAPVPKAPAQKAIVASRKSVRNGKSLVIKAPSNQPTSVRKAPARKLEQPDENQQQPSRKRKAAIDAYNKLIKHPSTRLVPSTSTMSNVTAAKRIPSTSTMSSVATPKYPPFKMVLRRSIIKPPLSPIKMVFRRSAPETLISTSSKDAYEVTYCSTTAINEEEDQ